MESWELTAKQFASMSPQEKSVHSGYVNGDSLNDIAAAAGFSRDMATHTACKLRHRGIPVPRAQKCSYLNGPIMRRVVGILPNGVRRTCYSQVWEDAVLGVVSDGGVLE